MYIMYPRGSNTPIAGYIVAHSVAYTAGCTTAIDNPKGVHTIVKKTGTRIDTVYLPYIIGRALSGVDAFLILNLASFLHGCTVKNNTKQYLVTDDAAQERRSTMYSCCGGIPLII